MINVFPWTEATVSTLLTAFSGNTSFKVTWPWAPFHERGFRAFKWAVENKVQDKDLNGILDDLSCPSAPPSYMNILRRKKLIDLDNRLLPLDPGPNIKKTIALMGKNRETFLQSEALLLTIDDLIARKPEILELWRPYFNEDFQIFTKWLSKNVTALKSFQESAPWDQLRIIESFVGVINSSSTLKFERIY